MAQLSEIDIIRRKRRRKIFFGRALLLVSLTLVGVGIYLVKDVVKTVDIGGFFGSGLASVQPGPGFPVDFAGEHVKSMHHVGRCTAVLTDTNLYIYNPNGRLLRDVQHKFSDPVVRIDGRRVLLYDRGGRRLRVETLTSTAAQAEFEFPIYAGDIAANGDVAVVTGAQHYNAELAVYDAKLSEQRRFTWKSPDQYIVDISFTTDGKGIAAAGVSAQGGDLVSKVRLYRFDQQEMQAESVFRGELIHSIECVRGGVIAVTDARAALLDSSGATTGEYLFHYETLASFAYSDDGETALVFGDALADKSSKLVLLNAKCEKQWERRVSSHTILMSIDNSRLGLVSDGKLIIYNSTGQEAGRQNLDAVPLGLTINGKYAYLVTPDSMQKLAV